MVYALIPIKSEPTDCTDFPTFRLWHSGKCLHCLKSCVYVRRAQRMISHLADESAFTSKLARQLSHHRTSRGTCDGCRAELQRTRYHKNTKYNTHYDNQYVQA